VGSGFLFHHFLTNADAGEKITPRSSMKNWKSAKLTSTDSHWKAVYHVQFLTNAAIQHIQQVKSHLTHYHSNRGSSANTITQRTYKTTFYTCRHIHSLNEYVRKAILHP